MATVISVVIAAAAVFALSLGRSGASITPFVLVVLVGPLAWICVLVHELGHAIAAWLVGWRVVTIAVWPIAWLLPHNEIVVGRGGRFSDVGGYVRTTPRRLSHHGVIQNFIITAGGPLASLALAVGGLLCFAPLLDGRLLSDGARASMSVMAALGVISGLAILSSLWPTRDSDGGHMLNHLLRRARMAGAAQADMVHWMRSFLADNVRLRELPQWMMDAARADAKAGTPEAADVEGLEIGRALDADPPDVETARALSARYRETHGGSGWLDSIDGFIAAVYDADPQTASACLARLAPGEEKHELALAVLAAIYAREGDITTSAIKLDAMDTANASSSPFLNHTYRDIRRQIEQIAGLPP